MKEDKNRICPVSRAKSLDTFFRRWFQNPEKIFRDYVKEGMTIVDYGCGPGFFTGKLAEMAGKEGRVIAVDLQEEMLEIARAKITENEILRRISFQQCRENTTDVTAETDLVIAFYVIHEVKNHQMIFSDFYRILKNGGILFISEPLFHVNKKEFRATVSKAEDAGFRETGRPTIHMSRTSVLKKIQT